MISFSIFIKNSFTIFIFFFNFDSFVKLFNSFYIGIKSVK
jgi:hypothetical protein